MFLWSLLHILAIKTFLRAVGLESLSSARHFKRSITGPEVGEPEIRKSFLLSLTSLVPDPDLGDEIWGPSTTESIFKASGLTEDIEEGLHYTTTTPSEVDKVAFGNLPCATPRWARCTVDREMLRNR